MSMHPNYILPPKSETHAQLARELIANRSVISDETGLNNYQKMEFIREVFGSTDATIFSEIAYEQIYIDDTARTCEAASFVAELRTQYLAKMLDEKPADARSHYLYLVNRQWCVRLRERSRMQAYNKMSRKYGRMH